MKIHLPYIFIIILLITVYFLDSKNKRLERELLTKQLNDLKIERDSISARLGRSELERNLLHITADSLLHHSAAIQSNLDKANKKLKNIPGTYDKVPQDSLGQLMDKRAKDAVVN